MDFFTELDKKFFSSLTATASSFRISIQDVLLAIRHFAVTFLPILYFFVLVTLLWKANELITSAIWGSKLDFSFDLKENTKRILVVLLLVIPGSYLFTLRVYIQREKSGRFSFFGWLTFKDCLLIFIAIFLFFQIFGIYLKLWYFQNTLDHRIMVSLFLGILALLYGLCFPVLIAKIAKTICRKSGASIRGRRLFYFYTIISHGILFIILIIGTGTIFPKLLISMVFISIYLQAYFVGSLLFRMYQNEPEKPNREDLLDAPIQP